MSSIILVPRGSGGGSYRLCLEGDLAPPSLEELGSFDSAEFLADLKRCHQAMSRGQKGEPFVLDCRRLLSVTGSGIMILGYAAQNIFGKMAPPVRLILTNLSADLRARFTEPFLKETGLEVRE